MGWRLPPSAIVEPDDAQKRLNAGEVGGWKKLEGFTVTGLQGSQKLSKSENYQWSTCRFKELDETLPFITVLVIIFHHRTYICMYWGCEMTNYTAALCTSTTDFFAPVFSAPLLVHFTSSIINRLISSTWKDSETLRGFINPVFRSKNFAVNRCRNAKTPYSDVVLQISCELSRDAGCCWEFLHKGQI
jgi:hypothetical protein